jgi:UDP-N-acetyl-D-mannosaminuronate dehydrogenase
MPRKSGRLVVVDDSLYIHVIGLSTAKVFLNQGYVVFGVDINSMDNLSIESEIEERFHFHRGNLAEEGKCDEIVRLCVEKYG